jgi:hypothetical protein
MFSDDADPRIQERGRRARANPKQLRAGGPPAHQLPAENLAGIERRGQIVILSGQENFRGWIYDGRHF